MIKKLHIYILSSLFTVLLGCSAAEEEQPSVPVPEGDRIFDVEFETRAGEDGNDDLLNAQFINGQSVILISQRGENLSLDFEDYMTDPDNPSLVIPNTNLYKYVYYTNPSADWAQGFDFQPVGEHALDWDAIEKAGKLNSDYSLGALFYPVQYEVHNYVDTDQSILNNLLRSNIQAAWHKTNSLRSRLRFKFYHMMAAVRVTLLVPVWRPEDNSGFGEDAVQSASMLSVQPNFSIDWPLELKTEDFPLPQLSTTDPLSDIKMYLESASNEVKTVNLHDLNPGFPNEEDSYREATFLMLLPPQNPASAGPAMRFILNSISGTERRYIWYSSDLVGSSAITFARNSLTHLTLYVPRAENSAILVKSYIVPWTEAESQFSVVPD